MLLGLPKELGASLTAGAYEGLMELVDLCLKRLLKGNQSGIGRLPGLYSPFKPPRLIANAVDREHGGFRRASFLVGLS